jgi:hypothetical protein
VGTPHWGAYTPQWRLSTGERTLPSTESPLGNVCTLTSGSPRWKVYTPQQGLSMGHGYGEASSLHDSPGSQHFVFMLAFWGPHLASKPGLFITETLPKTTAFTPQHISQSYQEKPSAIACSWFCFREIMGGSSRGACQPLWPEAPIDTHEYP